MKKLVLLMIVIMTSFALAETFNDGQIHYVDYYIDDIVSVWNDTFFDDPTTVNLIDEGQFQSTLFAREDSKINILGGDLFHITSYHYSHIFIQNGNISDGITLHDYSTGIIDGGNFNSSYIKVRDNSQLEIYNGNFDNVTLMIDPYSCTATIYGNNFHINGRPVSSGTYMSPDTLSGILTGTLIGGDNIEMPFIIEPSQQLIIVSDEGPYCTEHPTMDFNKDCIVNLIDFAEFASQWLVYNLEPQSYCN